MAKPRSKKCLQDQIFKKADGSEEFSPAEVALYRSLVGSGVNLSQERLDLSFTIKELASYMWH